MFEVCTGVRDYRAVHLLFVSRSISTLTMEPLAVPLRHSHVKGEPYGSTVHAVLQLYFERLEST